MLRVTKDTLEWVEANRDLLVDLQNAVRLVRDHGQIVITYRAGEYVGMDVSPRRPVRNLEKS